MKSSRRPWPSVIDENATLDKVLQGYSLARYGDGELKLCVGGDCISQVYTPQLGKELTRILRNNNPKCIVGIPNHVESPKKYFWDKVCSRPKYLDMVHNGTKFYSQFITRPDSAPWIDNVEFWDKLKSLWAGKDVTLVAGSERSLTEDKLTDATSVTRITGLYRDSYQIIDELEAKILENPNHVVLLCIGATATCLADRLSKKGKHAVDLGHIGMFWKQIKRCYDAKI